MNYDPQLHDKLVIVQLNCAFSWGTITDKAITDETNSNKGAVAGAMHVRKKLLPAAAGVHVEAVQSALSKFYQYHCLKTFSTPTRGQRVMPTAFHFEYEEKFAEAMATSTNALDNLVNGFDAAVLQAQKLLGSSFKQEDYPAADEIRRYFTLHRQFLPVPSGDAIMKALGAAVAADVDGYVGHIMTSAAADAKQRLRDAVQRVVDRCSAPKGKIYDSMTEAIEELVETLPEIAGLTGDTELQALVKEVRQNLTGFEPKALRESVLVRSSAAKAAADIMKRMGG
jgi:hypothetical protein